MNHAKRRLRFIPSVTAALLAVLLVVALAACGRTPAKATPTPTAGADPTAQAYVTDLDALAASIDEGLDLEAIGDDLDAPLPTGATADVAPLLTEAAAMAKDLSDAIPTVYTGE